ncbi:MAG: DNA ligase (NAD(+)) LigA [Bacteroidetes bacterium MED-G13]|nr:MAG: DNA ligase (NAD(+)) LigA [Bacteroidetes bacterium MED-G13]
MSVKNQIFKLREKLHEHNYNYYVLNNPTISDYEFDMLLNDLKKLEESHPNYFDHNSPTQRIGGEITKSFENSKHLSPMYSLDNSYSLEDLKEWEKRIKKIVTQPISYTCELKFDGISINLLYENGNLIKALTRGDGISGDDVTSNVKTIPTVPLKLRGFTNIKFEARGEIVMPIKGFNKLNEIRYKEGKELFKNTRNTASGTLKLQDSSEVASRPLECLIFSIKNKDLFNNHENFLNNAGKLGFNIFKEFSISQSLEDIFKFIKYWENKRSELPFEIDGAVVKVNDYVQRDKLGYTSKFPRWAMAYKFKPQEIGTRLNSISFQVGRTGSITPVANLEPVELAGTIVKRASLHNSDFIKKLDIRVGDYVYIEKGGDIIPKITKVNQSLRPVNSLALNFISNCPECGNKLTKLENEANHYCFNEDNCQPQVVGRIQHFISRKAMDIDGLGQETVSLLVRNGLIRNYADLYDLKYEQIVVLERMAEKSANNLIQGILRSKNISFERVLYALGIRHVGETVAKKLVSHFSSIENIINADFDELILVDEIGDKIANSLIDFFNDSYNMKIINRLKERGLNFTSNLTNKKTSSLLLNKSFVISGVFKNYSRDALKKFIETNGGTIVSSVSSKTNFLVAGDKMGPSKKIKATEFGAKIISEFELEKMIFPKQTLF